MSSRVSIPMLAGLTTSRSLDPVEYDRLTSSAWLFLGGKDDSSALILKVYNLFSNFCLHRIRGVIPFRCDRCVL